MSYDLFKVSVIVPTLNEAKNLPLVLPRIPLEIVDEVVLVDGRSTDDTVEVARSILPGVKIVLEPAPGKGAAIRAGYRAATGDILIVVDADGSNDPRELPRFLRSLVEGADFVKGSRFAHHGGTTDMPRYRKMGNAFFVWLVNLLFGSTFTDLCYGYHAFWRYCLDVIDVPAIDGFEIDTFLYLRALRERLRIVEVPSFEGYRFYGRGKLQTIPDGLRVLATILREWFAHLTTARSHRDYMGFRGQTASYQALAARPALPVAALAGALQVTPSSALVPAASLPDPMRTDLRLLLAISHALALEINLRELLQRVLQLTLERAQASSGSIMVLNDRGDVVEGCLLYDGAIGPVSLSGHNEIVKQGLAGWVVRNRKPVLVSSTREDPRWLRRSWDEDGAQPRSAIGIPLMVAERVIGVLTLVRQRPRPFTQDDLETVSSLAALA